MTWRKELRTVKIDGVEYVAGSFRGAPFFVRSEGLSGGRALVVHEFPNRDVPVIEDLGGRAKRHRLEAYLLGDDHLTQRDTLTAALDTAGAGILVHPSYSDDIRARCPQYDVAATIKRAAMSTVSMVFIESPLDALTLALEDSPDLGAQAQAVAAATDQASEAQLDDALDVDDAPGYATESLSADITAMAEAVENNLGALEMLDQERAALQVAVVDITSSATTLARRPADMLNAFRTTLDVVPLLIEASARAVLVALLGVQDTAAQPLSVGDTEERDTERANQAEVAAALRRWALTSASDIAAIVTYRVEDDALADRAAIIERIDEQLQVAGDAVFPGLGDLRAAIALAIPGNAQLARILEIERPAAVPSILLAYQLYGTTSAETAILARNDAQHPGFLSGTLSVLSEVL